MNRGDPRWLCLALVPSRPVQLLSMLCAQSRHVRNARQTPNKISDTFWMYTGRYSLWFNRW